MRRINAPRVEVYTLTYCFHCGKGTMFPMRHYGMLLCTDCIGPSPPPTNRNYREEPAISRRTPYVAPKEAKNKIKIEEIECENKL